MERNNGEWVILIIMLKERRKKERKVQIAKGTKQQQGNYIIKLNKTT